MPAKGRPRLTPEAHQSRLAEYCIRYAVTLSPAGLPPFPAGRRETPQHREWIALYKAHNRQGRRNRGQCERCAAPVSGGSVFCAAHRAEGSPGASLDDRRARLTAQDGRCPICAQGVDLWDSVDHSRPTGGLRAVLHRRCLQLVGLVEATGPEALDRLRAYLRPKTATDPKARHRVTRKRPSAPGA